MATTVRLDGGKYEITFDDGRFYAKRYGQEWRDLTGDGMVLALVQECDSLREQRAALLAALKELVARRDEAAKAHPHYDGGPNGSDGRYARARAAIRAAEGEVANDE